MKVLKNKFSYFVGLLSILMLAGCQATPPQPNVSLNKDLLARDDVKIGIYYAAPEDKATTHIWGANCLLCYGVASALTGELDKHLAGAISTEELEALKGLVHAKYSDRFNNVKMVELPKPLKEMKDFKDQLGFPEKDFRELKDQLDIEVLVVMHIGGHGAHRSFSNYIPNGDPLGYIGGWLYSVDLETNAYLQYLKIDERVQPTGEWDEPPRFPSVTTAYYQAVENAKQKIDNSFK